MNKPVITFLTLMFSLNASAQIKNPGFEALKSTATKLPQNWDIKRLDGFKALVDENIKFTGKKSFHIESHQNVNPAYFGIVSQTFDITINTLKIINLSVYIKTERLKGSVALTCSIKDEKGNLISSQTVDSKAIKKMNTNSWTKYTLSVALNNNAKKVSVGGYLLGYGSAWFDEFTIGYVPFKTTSPLKQVKEYVNEITGLVKKHSIYTKTLNWQQIDSDISKLSKGINSTNDAQLVTGYILSELRTVGDNHSFLQSKTSSENYARQNLERIQPYSKLLGSNIGYLSVPGFESTNDTTGTSFAVKIQNMIRELDTQHHITGWIVDLRENHGGNMYPMIAGLGPLLGDATLGYFISPENNQIIPWKYEKGKAYNGGLLMASVLSPYTIKHRGSKIAVLIGPETSSSGEMTTISFIGKPNVKLVGQQTGGYTTANTGFKLSNGSYLYLATSYITNRNKKRHFGKINPDIKIESSKSKNKELTVRAAMIWIFKHSG